ncbi:MAG: DUF2490 domain-containing protein [Methylophilaceae bacterium]
MLKQERPSIKLLASILMLICTQAVFAEDDSLNFVALSASKQLSTGHTLIAMTGNIQEQFKGKLAYLGVSKKLENKMIWSLGYLGYYPKNDKGSYNEDHRVRGSLAYTFKFDGWQLMHRSRVEYRMGQAPNGFRYRPALELSSKVTAFNTLLIPYVEVEPFYDFRQD